jgi:hypothetical protein
MNKLLVLFVFHIYNDRVQKFIENCIFKDENVDFIIISNNYNEKFYYPDYVNFVLRDNIGYDFGGWSDGLLINNLYKNYDNFIFVNSSVIGPFLPKNYIGKWTDIYLNGLQNNIKLFGSTINTCSDPLYKSHVQSYIFSMNKETLEFLIKCEIFSITNYAKTMQEAILNKEVLMSRRIIDNKWNIGSLLNYYKDVDFTFNEKKPEDYNIIFLDDIMFINFKDIIWNMNELVFIKGNRIPLNIIMRCLYGKQDMYKDVTDIVKEHFVKDNDIVIPQNTMFNDLFGDIIPNEVKALYIEIGDKKILITEDDIRKHTYKIDGISGEVGSLFRVLYGNEHQHGDITDKINKEFYKDDEIVIKQELDFRIEFGNVGNIGLYDNNVIVFPNITSPNKYYVINEKDVYDKEHRINIRTMEMEMIKKDPIPINYDMYKVPNWTPNPESKIYLIANNDKIDTEIFDVINEDDLVVCFNLSLFREKFKNHKNKILLIRSQHDYTWFGYKNTYNNEYLQTYFLTGYINDDFRNFRDNKVYVTDRILVTLLKMIDYPVNKVFTTGFFTYHFLKQIYENEIILMGYTFENPIHTDNKLIKNDIDWEMIYSLNNNLQIVDTTNYKTFKVCIFYHICAIGDYEQVVKEQINLIISSGLINIIDKLYYGILGEVENIDHIIQHSKIEKLYHNKDIRLYEIPTINKLYEFSLTNDAYVLYIHSKGVTNKLYNGINGQYYWRQLMNYYNIEKYNICINLLKKYNTCGINLNNANYSGNFWWATTDYLKTLDKLSDNINTSEIKINYNGFYKNRKYIDYMCSAEDFLLSRKIKNRHISIYGPYITTWLSQGYIGLYKKKIERIEYENKFDIRLI